MKTPKQITGSEGEQRAARYLTSKGYRIVEYNWKCSRAEIDIIAFDGDVLVFIEVKTRSYDTLGQPEDFVSSKKMNLISEAANLYMQKIQHQWEIRFDIVSIIKKPNDEWRIEHFEDAWFYSQ